jgi:uncharacterized protein
VHRPREPACARSPDSTSTKSSASSPRWRRPVAETVSCLVAAAALAIAAVAPVPPPQGFVTDRAGVVDTATREKLTRLLEELQQKTGAEIAVLTVDSTAPLDDFTYAMQVAEAWKPGKKGEDTGTLVLVATQDRKVRVVVGYGLEGILPDGLVGAIQDREMVPEFRAGRVGEGIWRGVAALANRIAASRGVQLTGVPAPRAAPPPAQALPLWLILLIVVVVLFLASRRQMGPGLRRGGGPVFLPGNFGGGGGGGFGGFGGGGGGFGGFGGGGFGGGGAGRSW